MAAEALDRIPSMLHDVLLFAQAAADTPPEGGAPPMLGMLVTLLPMMILGYLLLIRPEQRKQREHGDMLSKLKKNDRVLTAGGLIGVVASIKDNEDELTLKVDENSNLRLRVTKSSVVRVFPSDSGKETKAE